MSCARILHVLRRTKELNEEEIPSQLARCLGLLDLTALGIGSTLGLGVYVLAGAVAKTVAGPAVCISFLVAAIASAFAGLCYAEFAARVPKAGSAYVYSYVSVGEFIAFTIGWNLILEYVIGTASVAKGMANYIDSLTNYTMAKSVTDVMPIKVPFLAEYPDFFAFMLVFLITILLSIGVNESAKLNNVFTMLNMLTVTIVVICGAIKSNPANWNLQLSEIPKQYQSKAGSGGFMPWGISGIMAGAAKCFFGFVGFDCVATTGEEAKNPKRDIPLSIVMSLAVIFISYFSIATVLTMMVPYYLQDADAPFPHAFDEAGMPIVKWVVTIGAIFALCTSLLGAMFPLPRVLYAMGSDGLLFKSLARINNWSKTPLLATVLSGLFAAVMATVFNLNQLIDMMSIGTLLAYTIVATSVLFLRYNEESSLPVQTTKPTPDSPYSVFKQTFNLLGLKYPTSLSSTIAKITIVVLFVVALGTCAVLTYSYEMPGVVAALGAILVLLLVILYRQPRQNVKALSFAIPCFRKADYTEGNAQETQCLLDRHNRSQVFNNPTFAVPLVPLVPYLSVIMNVYLMVQLDYQTWVRFIIWLVIGYIIYFFYGTRNSILNEPSVKSKTISLYTVNEKSKAEQHTTKI